MKRPPKERNIEAEANQFALALLMPADQFTREFRRLTFDLSDEKSTDMVYLAKKFGVSVNAVVARISMLEL